MIALGAHTNTFTTVFTAPATGVYTFVAVGGGQFRVHNGVTSDKLVYDTTVIQNQGSGINAFEQHSFSLVLFGGDELQHQNGPADLYGVRIGDEL